MGVPPLLYYDLNRLHSALSVLSWRAVYTFAVALAGLLGFTEIGSWISGRFGDNIRFSLMRPALTPQLGSNGQRINLALLPPSPLIAGRVIFTMVDGTKGHGEFIAHFKCQASRLCITDMMCVGRGTPTDDAWLGCDKT